MLKHFSSADMDVEEAEITDQPENETKCTNEKTSMFSSPTYM